MNRDLNDVLAEIRELRREVRALSERAIIPMAIVGHSAAARFCGYADARSFRQLATRHGVRPRILEGRAVYRRRDLEKLVDPDRNAIDAKTEFRGTRKAGRRQK